MANNKTQLGLNQWTTTEKPLMAEFNSDNRLIDEKLRELTNKVNKHDVEWFYPNFLDGAKPYPWNPHKARYGKSGALVSVQGVVIEWTTAKPMFILPEGFKPYQPYHMSTLITRSNGSDIIPANIRITEEGEVIPVYSTPSHMEGDSYWLYLSANIYLQITCRK